MILTKAAEEAEDFTSGGISTLVPASKIQVKDTIGAGDAFFSMVLAYLFEQGLLNHKHTLAEMTTESLESCLSYAGKAAAINCIREVADPPNKSEME